MTKKSFKDHPALQFISPPPPLPEAAAAEDSPAPGDRPKTKPLYMETRSQRVQLLMQPGLHARLKRQAAQRGRSLNDLIHVILTDWLNSSG